MNANVRFKITRGFAAQIAGTFCVCHLLLGCASTDSRSATGKDASAAPADAGGGTTATPEGSTMPTPDGGTTVTPDGSGAVQPDAAVSTPTVYVTETAVDGVPTVSRGLIGGNLRWPDDADGVLTSTGAINATIAEKSLEMGLGSIRYPGGTVADMFDWTHSADPVPSGCQTNAGFYAGAAASFTAIPSNESQYTIYQHAQFLSAAGQPVTNLMIPMINRTPEDAASFVLSVAKQTGQTDFVVEIGNEPFLLNQHYWRAQNLSTRLEQYINGTRGYAQSEADQQDDTSDSVDSGWHALFRSDSCELRSGAIAGGTADQTFRPRYVPIEESTESSIVIQSSLNGVLTAWTYVGDLGSAGPDAHVFTVGHLASLGAGHNVFIFGDGTHGAKPNGAMSMALRAGTAYGIGNQPGFIDFYKALKQLAGTQYVSHINVCSSWSQPSPSATSSPELLTFVDNMANQSQPYDCMAVHTYNSISSASSASDYNAQLQIAAANLGRELGKLQAAMRADGHGDRFLEVTEYGSLQTPMAYRDDFIETLYRTRLVMGQVQSGVRIGNSSNFAGLFVDPDADGRYVLSSTARMLSLWRRMVSDQPMTIHYCDPSDSCTPSNVQILATRSDGGDVWNIMILNTGSTEWIPNWNFAGHSGTSCLVIRRMQTALDTKDAPSSTANDGVLPSMRPVFIKEWKDDGTHLLPDGNGDGSRTAYPYSIELMSVVPVTADSQGCTIPPPFSMEPS